MRDLEPVGRERRAESFGPFDEGDPVRLALVEEPAADRLRRIGQAIEVEVEQRQAARVLGHEHEARRVHRGADAETLREALGELGLARAEVARQAMTSPGSATAARPAASRGSPRPRRS